MSSPLASQSICLTMIVKQEAHIIARCLESVKRHIVAYAIVDTGSTDGTQDVIRKTLAGIPGTIENRPWVGFATNRQQALDLAKGYSCEYLLTLDADEVLVWPADKSIPHLDEDVYGIRFKTPNDDSTWMRSFLFRSSLPWKWIGEVHEHLDCTPRILTQSLFAGKAHILSYSDGGRSVGKPQREFSIYDHLPGKRREPWVDKFLGDAAVLEKHIAAHPDDCSRQVFYLAQSYAGAQKFDKAIENFKRRIAIGGNDEEVYFSYMQLAGIHEHMGGRWEEVARKFVEAYNSRPTRAEPLWALAVLHNDRGEPAVAAAVAHTVIF